MARTAKSRTLRFTRPRPRNWRNFGEMDVALAELATQGNGGLQAAV